MEDLETYIERSLFLVLFKGISQDDKYLPKVYWVRQSCRISATRHNSEKEGFHKLFATYIL